MCLFISPNHIQKLAYDLSLKFNFIMSVPNLLCPMGLQLRVWHTRLSPAEITQWGCIPRWCIRRAGEREGALFYPLPSSKARLHSGTTELLKMKTHAALAILVNSSGLGGWLAAFLSDWKTVLLSARAHPSMSLGVAGPILITRIIS